MKKIKSFFVKGILLTVIAALCAVPLAGCFKGNDSGKLKVLWDSSAFLYGFDELGKAITIAESKLASGSMENTALNRACLDNSKIMKQWADDNGVKIQSLSWGWADTLTQKLLASFLSADGPDIMLGETQMPKFAEDGNLAPFPDDLAEYVRTNLSPIAYKAMEFGGKIYGVAINPSPMLLVRNNDILIRAGYAKDSDMVVHGPKTWAQWEEAMKKVYDARLQNVYAGGAYLGQNIGGHMRIGALMDSVGGGFKAVDGKPEINTTENERAFAFARRSAGYNSNGVLNATNEDTYFTAFDKGQIAFKVDGLWSVKQAEDAAIDCGYGFIPGETEGQKGNMLTGAGYMAVPDYAPRKELAFSMLKTMLDERIQKNIAGVGLRAPVSKAIINSDEYMLAQPVHCTYARAALSGSVSGLPSFKCAKPESVWKAFNSAISATVNPNNKNPISDILAGAQKEMLKAFNSK